MAYHKHNNYIVIDNFLSDSAQLAKSVKIYTSFSHHTPFNNLHRAEPPFHYLEFSYPPGHDQDHVNTNGIIE